ncbi:MAG: hypothetical protein J6Y20_07755 [Lachnospiraceae bacterium]|nr:hypothetical protein [Lachnospiraceae bacterium]
MSLELDPLVVELVVKYLEMRFDIRFRDFNDLVRTLRALKDFGCALSPLSIDVAAGRAFGYNAIGIGTGSAGTIYSLNGPYHPEFIRFEEIIMEAEEASREEDAMDVSEEEFMRDFAALISTQP